MAITGTIFDIQRFSLHDGPGIRTTVFLKGCPLRCLWCHNPESQKREREISFIPDRCIGCGWCFEACPGAAHVLRNGRHVLLREFCGGCGACAEGCYSGAIEVIGREMTVEDVLADVVRDRPFYDGGGGVTISGGEPMMQFEFTRALLRAAREAGVHTCLDTCGFAPTGSFMELLDGVDLFLYDLKDTDPERHLQTTGGPLEPILANLAAIDAAGGRIILRCPLIPDVNDDEGHLRGIADVANSLKNVIAVDLHPYHPFGRSKVARLGACDPSAGINSADAKDVSRWLSVVEAATRVPVRAL
ncbi:MAG: glycyl-radical enzyme activating protein [Phycisphaerae bacterium]|nr:glycyl-radical enzyme activating protein [Phycisphaerae bacterium]